jgi:acetyl esterase/lipase
MSDMVNATSVHKEIPKLFLLSVVFMMGLIGLTGCGHLGGKPDQVITGAGSTPGSSRIQPGNDAMENLELIPPYPMFGEPFPESEELPEGTISVKWTDKPGSVLIDLKTNVVYQSLSGEDQHLQIITPLSMIPDNTPARKYPLVAYIQGSAWMRQNIMMSLPLLIQVAQAGYVVAIVEYRPTEIAMFPAQIEDAKSAIRYMIEYAEEYHVDPGKIIVWGDSSGGHTAVSVGISGDVPVKCIVDWYGPTDIKMMNYYPSKMDHISADSPEGKLLGNKPVLENIELAEQANPITHLSIAKPTPPILIMHGGSDGAVPFNQSVRLYNKLRELGKEVTFYKLEGGDHGTGGFNSDECLRTTLDYIASHIN